MMFISRRTGGIAGLRRGAAKALVQQNVYDLEEHRFAGIAFAMSPPLDNIRRTSEARPESGIAAEQLGCAPDALCVERIAQHGRQ